MGRYEALLEELGFAKSSSADDSRDDSPMDDDIEETDDGGELHPNDQAVLKAFRRVVDVVSAQGRAIDAMRSELDALKRPGQPMEKALRRAGEHGLDSEAFMAKALGAQSAGRITGVEVAIAEAHINAGKVPPGDLVRAVMADEAP